MSKNYHFCVKTPLLDFRLNKNFFQGKLRPMLWPNRSHGWRNASVSSEAENCCFVRTLELNIFVFVNRSEFFPKQAKSAVDGASAFLGKKLGSAVKHKNVLL